MAGNAAGDVISRERLAGDREQDHPDGVEAARMCGIDGVELRLEPELVCDADDLDTLMNVDALVITLPARRSGPGESFYLQAMQEIVDSALAHHVPRIVFTSSTSVYGEVEGVVKESSERRPVTASGQVLKELEDWLHNLPGTQVDIVRLAGLVGPGRHPGRFFAGKTAPDGQHGVNLVHLEDVIGAIELLLQAPKGGHIYNICAPTHPARSTFYPLMARQLGLAPPVFGEAKDGSKGKIVDGNRICHELGFEYQYPDPLVMPME
jgi:nucleoside-diphosphate-sugar epimerase